MDNLPISPFGHLIPKKRVVTPIIEVKTIDKYEPVLIQGTGSTEIKLTEQIDVCELIASYKDECGMAAAMRAIKTGQVSKDAFADDGQHGGDISGSPDYMGDLQRAAQAAQAKGQDVAQALGLDLGAIAEDQIQAIVEKRIAEIIAAQQAAKPTEGEDK